MTSVQLHEQHTWHAQPAGNTSVGLAGGGPAGGGKRSGGVDGKEKLRVAVLITGRLGSLSFNTTGYRVVKPNVKAGHTVDVFASLANGGFDCKSAWGASFAKPETDWPTIERDFGDLIRSHGGRLAGMDVRQQFKTVQITDDNRMYQWSTEKMRGQKCAALQQHYNRYHGFRLVEQEEVRLGKLYDFIVYFREDAYWLQDIKPIHVFNRSAVSIKGCLRFGGINDKGAVVPRKFARAWFDVILHHYLYQLPKYKNPEDFNKKAAEVQGVPMVEVPPGWFPQLDLRDITTKEVKGVLRQDGRSGCFHPLYVGGKSLEPDDHECACVPKGYCESVKKRLCAW
eukprot:CAMPEP_0181296850 /NCGR_PEP_ID=MMETSP1101-20121128/4922_1 /TAXON_ID=46948 /ORGANISM="Rhodomonas abbreviata, Strain Caron Lab Isolate" /LENGTH=339 /DNA_ID=CAMNT_0023401739 /DNA_START=280 /DNA_END=1296 /DNA_ORIENTATION=+